jgi:PTH1 family peptidyl-tRNA hydrolase
MPLIVGLGNPGPAYSNSPHNIGAATLSSLAISIGLEYQALPKLSSQLAKDSKNLLLAIPTTFMNNSGQAVRKLVDYFKLETSQVWIVHDELDLPLGRLQVAYNKSAAGHKGVQSVIQHLGTQSFYRFRLGVQPPHQSSVNINDYVTSPFSASAAPLVASSIQNAVQALTYALQHDPAKAASQYNQF